MGLVRGNKQVVMNAVSQNILLSSELPASFLTTINFLMGSQQATLKFAVGADLQRNSDGKKVERS